MPKTRSLVGKSKDGDKDWTAAKLLSGRPKK